MAIDNRITIIYSVCHKCHWHLPLSYINTILCYLFSVCSRRQARTMVVVSAILYRKCSISTKKMTKSAKRPSQYPKVKYFCEKFWKWLSSQKHLKKLPNKSFITKCQYIKGAFMLYSQTMTKTISEVLRCWKDS